MRSFLILLKRFERDERGIFAVFFGLLAVVLVATAGAVVDYTTVAQARTRAQDALDSAALGLQPRIYDDATTEEDLKDEAQLLLTARLADEDVTATVDDAQMDEDTGQLRLTATIGVPTSFIKIVGVNAIDASVVSEVRRGALNIEVALALDVTGSMGSVSDPSSRINAAKTAATQLVNAVVQDDQTPNYSKLALIPWSSAVNVGTYADTLRGAATQNTTITGASWRLSGSGSVRTIESISAASPPVVKTTSNHGYATGDIVNISNVAGSSAYTDLNGNSYTITVTSSSRFTLTGVNLVGASGSYTANSGKTTTYEARAISNITSATNGEVTTSRPHGLATDDAVYITNTSGGDFDTLGGEWFTVTVVDSTHFTLNGSQGNTSSYGTYTANSGVMRKCLTNECEIVISSTAHGLADNEHVYINNASWLNSVTGDDEVGNVWEVTDVTADTYVLENSTGPDMGTYAANGRSWCTRQGCEYFYFDNNDSSPDYSLHRIRTCVTERIVTNQYTDIAPATTYVGRQYTASSSGCLSSQIKPLTSDKTALTTAISALTTSGTTAGQVGTAWAWYMLSPNFASLFPTDNQAAAYTAPHTKKIAIIMTDGEYNTPYCDGVVAQDHSVGWIIPDDEANNCNANNGAPLAQSASMCTAMKAAGIQVYTVGFQLGSDTGVVSMLTNCATSPSDAYLADDSTELMAAFETIAEDITDLRLAQ